MLRLYLFMIAIEHMKIVTKFPSPFCISVVVTSFTMTLQWHESDKLPHGYFSQSTFELNIYIFRWKICICMKSKIYVMQRKNYVHFFSILINIDCVRKKWCPSVSHCCRVNDSKFRARTIFLIDKCMSIMSISKSLQFSFYDFQIFVIRNINICICSTKFLLLQVLKNEFNFAEKRAEKCFFKLLKFKLWHLLYRVSFK